MLLRPLHVALAATAIASGGSLDGCRCECGGGSGGTLSTPTVHNVSKSRECDAVCTKIEACGAQCDRDDKCKIDRGKCAASKKALLRCEADKGAFTCLPPSGYSMASPCAEDESLCTGADPDTTKLPLAP